MAFYYDFPVVGGAGKSSPLLEALVGQEAPNTRAAGKSALLEARAAVETTSARAGGRSVSQDALAHAETVGMQAGGREAVLDPARFRDLTNPHAAGQSSAITALVAADLASARGAGRASEIDGLVASDQVSAHPAGRSAAPNTLVAAQIALAASGGKSASGNLQKGTQLAQISAAEHSALLEQRGITETVAVRAGGRATLTDALVAVQAVSAAGALRSQATEAFLFDLRNLVTNVRANAKRALPECLEYPEALPDMVLFKTLKLPLLIIAFAQPEPSTDWAVMDVGQSIKCEFVYIARTVGNGLTDNAQVIRSRLALLERALMLDYRQRADTGAPTCTNTMLIASPAQRANDYQRFLTSEGQGVSCMVTTLEFVVVESLVGA